MNSKRYYPNLLSPEHRILGDYFRSNTTTRPGESKLNGLSVVAGTLLLIGSFFTLPYLPFFLVLFTTGLLLMPRVGRMVAGLFRIRLTRSVRRIMWIVLLLLNVPLAISFGGIKLQQAKAHRVEEFKHQQAVQLAQRKEQQRRDSLDSYLQKISDLHQNGETDKALLALDKADVLAKTPGENADVSRKRIGVSLDKAKELMTNEQYNMAVELLSSLDTNDSEVRYQRARSYAKTGRNAEAARDARSAMLNGHAEAKEFYEKINPLKKRVAYYTTLCNDGSFSGAKGRGACSHHDGVADWNYPVYETYRQYE